MFAENKDTGQSGIVALLDAFGRQHPALFSVFLMLLGATIAIGLLLKPAYTLVLYQGF
jgi:hypothetical protein